VGSTSKLVLNCRSKLSIRIGKTRH